MDEVRGVLVRAEVHKACDALAAADSLLTIGLWDDAVSRLYYAVFHMASAALLAIGVEATSHRAVQSLVSLHLVKTGRVSVDTVRGIAELFALRNQADYNRLFAVDRPLAEFHRAQATGTLAALAAVIETQGFGAAGDDSAIGPK